MTVSDTIGRAGCILLVEDDPDAAEFFCRVLRSGSGFEVVHELGAEGALCRVRSGKQWDLLITDIELPGMSGLELLEQARELIPDLPVALITAHP